MAMPQGTVTFRLLPLAKGKLEDGNSHKLAHIEVEEGLDVVLFKNADRSLEVRVVFEHFVHRFFGSLPEIPESGLPVIVSWDEKTITLWVNGEEVVSEPLGGTRH